MPSVSDSTVVVTVHTIPREQPSAEADERMLTYDDPRRKILEHLPERERSLFANQVHFAIRAGAATAEAVAARVEREYLHREAQHEKYRDTIRAEQARRALSVLVGCPGEVAEFIRWAFEYEALPREERERLKAGRGEQHRRTNLDRQPPTDKQIRLCRALGYAGAIESKAHASEIIDRLKGVWA